MRVKTVPNLHFSEQMLASGEVRDPRISIRFRLKVKICILERDKVLHDNALEPIVLFNRLTGISDVPLSLIVLKHLSDNFRSVMLPLFKDRSLHIFVLISTLHMSLLEI